MIPLLEEAHGERTPAGKRKAPKPVVEEGVERPEVEAEPKRPLRPPTYAVGIEGEERPIRPGQLPRPPGRGRIPAIPGAKVSDVTPTPGQPPGEPGIVPGREPGEGELEGGRPDVPPRRAITPSPVDRRPRVSDKEVAVDISPDLEYEVNKPTEKSGELTDSLFENYVPTIKAKGAQKHPAPLAESAAMAAVDIPPITYKPKIPQNLIDSGKLSDIQLELIALAGQAHEQIMPDGQRAGI